MVVVEVRGALLVVEEDDEDEDEENENEDEDDVVEVAD